MADFGNEAVTWGKTHFGTARLGDQRRTRSLVDLADRVLAHPGGSLPDKFADPNALQRCYELMNCPKVTHAAVLEPHRQHTRQLLAEHHGVVLLLRDNTELDFSGKRSLHGQLGQLSCSYQHGYICHNILAVNPLDRSAFGLAGQVLHVRDDVADGETQQQKRDRQSRESLLWLRGLDDFGPAPAGALWVEVGDAGCDTFEYLDDQDAHGRRYVIRAAQDRRIWVGHGPVKARSRSKGPTLFKHLRTLPELSRRAVQVPARDGRPARQAEVALAYAAVQIRPPEQPNGKHRDEPLRVGAVRVWEVNPPADVGEPIEWFLLTNVAVESVEQAWEKADWYTCRWVVEELHKGMKTGCSIEAPQFTTAAALRPMIALLSVVAVALLNVRDLSRQEQTSGLPAERFVPQEYVQVLSGWRYQQGRPLCVREFYLALARLGGHLNRKRDHPPGWLILWRGWTKLHLMVEGARAARRAQQATPLVQEQGRSHKLSR